MVGTCVVGWPRLYARFTFAPSARNGTMPLEASGGAHPIFRSPKEPIMNTRILVLAAAVALGALGTAHAQGADTPRVDQRQANQQRRIDQGVASGALTPREAARLRHQQGHVAAAEARAKSDGQVTRAERARLHAMQDRASGRIYRQKHDRQRVH